MVKLVNMGREFRAQTRGLSYREMARETGIPAATCWRIHHFYGVGSRTLDKVDAYLLKIGVYDENDVEDVMAFYQPRMRL